MSPAALARPELWPEPHGGPDVPNDTDRRGRATCKDCAGPTEWWWEGYKNVGTTGMARCHECYRTYARASYARRKSGVRPRGPQGRTKPEKPKYEVACPICCTVKVSPYPQVKFCSDRCRSKAKGNLSKRTGTCRTCGSLFRLPRGTRTNKKYCGLVCMNGRERKPKPPPQSRIQYRDCKQCGKLMVARGNQRYCSKQCSTDNINARVMGLYRAAFEAADVPQAKMWWHRLVAYLVERDGNDCGICGHPVDVTLPSGPRGDDLGPSVDHVVPRSKGGGDELSNLRLAHWSCNRNRGNRGETEQLRLVG